MKTPSRTFVVEYKSSRRRSLAQPSSIWGNIDIQAVARQVTDEGLIPVSLAIDEGKAARSGSSTPSTALPSNQGESIDNQLAIKTAGDSDAVSIDATKVDARKLERKAQARSALPKKAASMLSTARSKRTSTRLQVVPQVEHDHQSRVEDVDSLVHLEAENRRLKRLLAAQFRDENQWLNATLLRFK